MILPLARAHGLAAVWLTVKPGNDPSIRTCQILGARYMGTVRVPATHPANYQYGMKYLRRYRLSTKEIGGRSRAAREARKGASLRGR
jgi:hypothetical protein